jgi:hypothetical protein
MEVYKVEIPKEIISRAERNNDILNSSQDNIKIPDIRSGRNVL